MARLNSKFMHDRLSSRKRTLLVGWTCLQNFLNGSSTDSSAGKGLLQCKNEWSIYNFKKKSFHLLVSTCWIKWVFMKACAFTDRLVHYKHPHCQLLCGKLQTIWAIRTEKIPFYEEHSQNAAISLHTCTYINTPQARTRCLFDPMPKWKYLMSVVYKSVLE